LRGRRGSQRVRSAGPGRISEALALRATGGEIMRAIRDAWGVYQPHETL